jgi:hypothetical protein
LAADGDLNGLARRERFYMVGWSTTSQCVIGGLRGKRRRVGTEANIGVEIDHMALAGKHGETFL